jgi:eukaryotic-like serine/threonine-protein kinase
VECRVYRHSAAGLVESIRNLDAVDDTLFERTGIVEMRCSYDAAGHLVTVSWHSKTGKLAINQDSFARLSFDHDRLGRNISNQFLGVDGKPTLRKEGYASLRSKYDERGTRSSEPFPASMASRC